MAELDTVKPWIDAYLEANRQIKRYEEIKAQARDRIVEALGGDDVGTVNGVEKVRIKTVAGRFDQKALREVDPDTYHRFTGAPTTRFEVVPDD